MYPVAGADSMAACISVEDNEIQEHTHKVLYMSTHLAEGHRALQVVVNPFAQLGDDLRVSVRAKRLALLNLHSPQRRF